MKFVIFNTLSRQKEEFIPVKAGHVWIYSCGPTVYGAPSIGNFRSFVFADLLSLTLRNILWYDVTHVTNVTDVWHLVSDGDDGEDKMEKWARKEWLSAWDVAAKFEKLFKDNLVSLHITTIDHIPKATNFIDEQIDLVSKLETKGYTYIIKNDGVYMDSSKVEDYGKLLWPNYKKHIEGLKSWARIDDTGKKNATDFALWKFSPTDQSRDMEWNSPRGLWFPGWHTECSAMARSYLGDQFDIHTAGSDQIPIHHTNEIAQSECAFGVKPWVKYWMHNSFLTVNGGKMWKSLWNAYTLAEIENKWFSALDLRYFYITTHYRSFQDFSWDILQSAANARTNLSKKLSDLDKNDNEYNLNDILQHKTLISLKDALTTQEWITFAQNIIDALCDDLNTPQMLAHINKWLKTPNEEILATIFWLDNSFLKLDLFATDDNVIEIPQEILDLAQKRLNAKNDQDYELADDLRTKILDMGFNVADTWDGFELEPL